MSQKTAEMAEMLYNRMAGRNMLRETDGFNAKNCLHDQAFNA